MRAAQVRLFAMTDVAHVDPDTGPIPAVPAGALELAGAEATIEKPDELGWWDWTVFLLHTAAEIEHALLAQYLYAAYSLADRDFAGPAVPPGASALTAQWRRTIAGIATEEMAHLLTVQNLLRFIGGPLNLEREDFPFRAFLYPFPLALEPLTKTSLAKYVAAEMPAKPPQRPEVIAEIVTRAAGGMPINRVGIVYDALADIFGDETKLATSDLRPETAGEHQAGGGDWHALDPLIVRAVASRDEAVSALRAIGEQGEGSAHPQPGAEPSHFDRFIQIYEAFPETDRAVGSLTWAPARSVPTNPNTLRHPSTDPAIECARITHPTTRLWAHLFNIRYRMLLADLMHALHLPGPLESDGEPTIRGHLRDWAFLEMRGRPRAGLRGLAGRLVTLPLKQAPGQADPANAGAPFELPYTLALPDDERDRWRLHLALLDTSGDLIGALVAAGGTNALLDELVAIDQAARAVVHSQL
jgi:hypothetical protein